MGGSSLAPDTLRITFGKRANYPELHVLDSSDPDQIRTLEAALDLRYDALHGFEQERHDDGARSLLPLFLSSAVQTRGWRTTLRASHFHRDYRSRHAARYRSESEAGFLRTYENDRGKSAAGIPHSRTSECFPAALAGYDVATIVNRGLDAPYIRIRARRSPKDAPGVRFGAAIATLAKSRDAIN